MAGLIKNQILKHLSRFAKNLSSDKLQFSTLRGHCELHNLELNEQVLTDLLELPSFLQLTRAVCNHVIVKIHWTKLKSVPICVSLDEVVIQIETCEDIRPRQAAGRSSSSSTGKYGFSDRVIDGMTVIANSVCVEFKSPVFQASFQLSRLVFESRTPFWKKADLRSCRLKSADTAEVLLFKYMEWQVLRIEAKAVESDDIPSVLKTTPLRLITNQAVCRITIKKKLADCSVVGSRVILVMDDLLWVLTDIQILAAIHFLRSLSDLVEASKKAKLILAPGQHPHETSKLKPSSQLSPITKLFHHCDVVEPSYHFVSKRIDFHLCDDAKDGRSQHSSLQGGGALQISLENLTFDYYPYNLCSRGREHWLRYNEPSSSRVSWVSNLLSSFQEQLLSAVVQADWHSASSSVRSSVILSDEQSSESRTPPSHQPQQRKPQVQTQISQLMSSCMVLRLEQYSIFKITTCQTNRKRKQQMFLYSKNSSLMLPDNMKAIHLEFTQYYYPSGIPLPVPPPHMFCHLGPLLLEVHERTLFWLNAFMLNFKKCLGPLMPKQQEKPVLGVRIEALMPEILIPRKDDIQISSSDCPAGLQVLASRVVATNCRSSQSTDSHSHLHLSRCLESFGQGTLLYSREEFPWHQDDMQPIAHKFLDHAANKDHYEMLWEEGGISLSVESRDVWSVHFDPIWMDFKYEGEGKKRLLPFMDPLPLTIWFTHKLENSDSESKNTVEADVYSLLHINSVIKLQTNHHQYLFLLHMFDNVLDLNLQLQKDTELICGPSGLRTMCLCSVIPLVEFSLILNTETQHIVLSPSCTDSESIMQDDSPSPTDEIPRVDTPGVKSATPVEDDQVDADGASIRDKSPACSSCSRNCVLPKSCSDSIIDSSIPSALDKQAEVIQKGYQTSTAVVKKGFISIMASIDSLRPKTDHPTPDSDNASVCDEDSLSIRSDYSSDSEFAITGMESTSWEDDMFKTHTEVEVANEVKEDTISNVTVSNSDLRRDVLSVMTAKIYCVEVVQQSLAQSGSCLLLQCSQVALSEYLAISWADFQNNFAAKSRGLKDFQEGSNQMQWQVRARLCQSEDGPGSLQMHLSHLDLSLTKSLLPLLATTLQDDSPPKSIPTRIEVKELRITLKTDFPVEEECCPLTFYIPGCVLDKTSKGLLQLINLEDIPKEKESLRKEQATDSGDAFVHYKSSPMKAPIPTISGQTGSGTHSGLNSDSVVVQANGIPKSQSEGEIKNTSMVLYQAQEEIQSIRRENESLKKQLQILRTIFSEDTLRQELANAMDEVHRLEDEKLQLSKTLKLMQGELNKFDIGK